MSSTPAKAHEDEQAVATEVNTRESASSAERAKADAKVTDPAQPGKLDELISKSKAGEAR